MQRRNFFSALAALAVAPFVPRCATPFKGGFVKRPGVMLTAGETIIPLSKLHLYLDGRVLAKSIAIKIPLCVNRHQREGT